MLLTVNTALRDAQASESIQQGAAWQAEFACHQGLVTAMLAQAIKQQFALNLLQAFTQATGRRLRQRVGSQGEVLAAQLTAVAQQYGPFDQALELSDVARKAVSAKAFKCRIRPFQWLTLQECAGLVSEVQSQLTQITFALAQCRQRDWKLRQAVIEVFTKRPFTNPCL